MGYLLLHIFGEAVNYALSVWLADTAGTSGTLEGVSDTWDTHSAEKVEHIWTYTGLLMVYCT